MQDSETPQTTFSELGLSPELVAAAEALGWSHATPIQTKAIPAGLGGGDIVGIAQTGTGKTGAFLLPSFERVEAGKGLQILALCPTRELAQQVSDDAANLCKGTKLRTATIYGGVKYGPQNEALAEGYEIIAATPGRFQDHINRGNVNLSNVKVLILDEADRMLDMGFRPQIEEILRSVPRNRQTLLFSATMPHGVHDLATRITKDAEWIEVAPSLTKAEGITEEIYSVKPDRKSDLLLHLLEDPAWEQVLIFTRTKAGADALKSRLDRNGIKTEAMHSDRDMRKRTQALEKFAQKEVRVLVATDIAQRGLDVDGISHVVNYDVPLDPEDYIHRIGRTGRAGASGTAVTFLAAGDLGAFKTLENRLGRGLDRIHLAEFDYAGVPMADKSSGGQRGRKSRSPRGMGAKKAADLSPEELAALLKHD